MSQEEVASPSTKHKDPNSTVQDDDEDEDNTANLVAQGAEFPKLDEAFLGPKRDITAETLKKYDEITVGGMHAFFRNDFAKADELFIAHFKEDPLVANAYGTLGSIKALLSFEPKDIDLASNRLIFSAGFGNGVQPPSRGILKSTWSWVTRQQTSDRLTPAQFRGLVVVGEAELLRANVLLIQDTFAGYIKAGLALRRGYNMFDRLLKYLQKYPDDHGVDANSIGGVHFGIGSIHVTTSILPPKILAILRALGYMHDREVGFQHLHKCLESNTMRSPIASLFLLAFHGILPSFAPLTAETNIPTAKKVIESTLAVFPHSVIHLWLTGRVIRLERRIPKAIDTLRKTISNAGDSLRAALPQLQHFATYDLAWSYCANGDWRRAARCFRDLEKDSAWSKMFYAYAEGACFDMMALDEAMANEDAMGAWSGPPLQTGSEAHVKALAIGKRLLMERIDIKPKPPQSASAAAAAKNDDDGGSNDDQEDEEPPCVLDDIKDAATRVHILREAARRCFQRAAHYMSIKLGGKVISVEQFARRRLKDRWGFLRMELADSKDFKEISTNPNANNNSIADDDYDAAKEGEAPTYSPLDYKLPGFERSNTDQETWFNYCRAQDALLSRKLSGLELALHFNVFTQCDLTGLARMMRYVEFVTKHCVLANEDSPVASMEEDAAIIKLMRATLLRELGRPKDAAELYQSLSALPKTKFPFETWIQPYALYERGILQYNNRTLEQESQRQWVEAALTSTTPAAPLADPIPEYAVDHSKRDDSREILTKKFKAEFGGKDYSFEMQMQFRLHLTNDMFTKMDQAAAAKEKAQ